MTALVMCFISIRVLIEEFLFHDFKYYIHMAYHRNVVICLI